MNKVSYYLGILIYFTLCHTVQAHVMVEQHATLRFTPKGAYFLASYPISAFKGIDDNQDGLIDQNELRSHQSKISKQVHKQVKLYDASQSVELEGLVINLSHSHDQKSAGRYLIVMGRFKPVQTTAIRFSSNLFGQAATEQSLKLRVTWQAKPIDFVLSPQASVIDFPQQMKGNK